MVEESAPGRLGDGVDELVNDVHSPSLADVRDGLDQSHRVRTIRYNRRIHMFESHGDAKQPRPSGPDAERDVKIEQLLLSGLDHYFKGRYQRAIDVWTRVLFLDRSHARARAYIERARAALAERMRESEEFLHTGVEAFNRGDVSEARELVTSAIERGGGRDEALALLDRMNRLETASGRTERSPDVGSRRRSGRVPETRSPRSAPRRPVRVMPLVLLSGLVVASAYVALTWDRWAPMLAGRPAPTAVGPAIGPTEPLPVPSTSEVTLLRAERLVAGGEQRQALALLASIGPGDPMAEAADAMRTAIQRELLASLDEMLPPPRTP